ncbi:MAG: DeoR/GlpR transcriptional regulator [Lentisphaerae bacterium]|nr:DeoR/GlpR transcriptional regulator [Lentisphaerota bacterium]
MSRTQSSELAAARLQKIAEIVRSKRIVRVDELSKTLTVSPATIRRDLRMLEKRGGMQRVHGGALSSESKIEEPMFDDKTAIATKEKYAIAQAALKFIKPNDSIFLDGGSTILTLAGMLQDAVHLTVVTNSLRVASTLSGKGPNVILVGGELRRLSQTFVGPLTKPVLDELHVDSAFIGTIALSHREGLTTTDPREAFTKKTVMAHARQVILLADSSKIGKISFVRFGSLSDVHILITDKKAARKQLDGIRKKGVRVIT